VTARKIDISETRCAANAIVDTISSLPAMPRTYHASLLTCFSFLLLALPVAAQVATSPALSNPSISSGALPADSDSSAQPVTSNEQPITTEEGRAVSPEFRRFHYTLKLEVSETYDNNLNLSNTNRIHDYYTRIAPSLVIGFGDINDSGENYLRASYSPHVLLFIDNDNLDTIEHLFRLDAQYRISRLTLVLAEDIAVLESSELNNLGTAGSIVGQANLDLSGRSRVNIFNTHLDGSYELAGKTSLTFSAEHTLSDPENNIGSQSIAGTLGLSWRYSDKVTIGMHGLGGYVDVEGSSSEQTYEQANITASYDATGKITAKGSAGVEVRQFENRGENITPVFQLSLNYAPFDGTTITANANRRVLSSGALVDQDYESTLLQLSVSQRLLQRFVLTVSGGYQNQTYFSTTGIPGANRKDNYYFIAPAIDVRIMRFWSAGVFYLRRENSSSFSFFGFNDDQFGIRTGLTF
jgi:hypothetical protein